MRKFKIQNGDGKILDITTKTLFFAEIDGIGYERDESYLSVGNDRIPVYKYLKDTDVKGTLIFYDENPYITYRQFLDFCAKDPLYLIYSPEQKHSPYYKKVSLQKVEKKELNQLGILSIPVTFYGLTPWYKKARLSTMDEYEYLEVSEIIESVDEDSEELDSEYPSVTYNFRFEDAGRIYNILKGAESRIFKPSMEPNKLQSVCDFYVKSIELREVYEDSLSEDSQEFFEPRYLDATINDNLDVVLNKTLISKDDVIERFTVGIPYISEEELDGATLYIKIVFGASIEKKDFSYVISGSTKGEYDSFLSMLPYEIARLSHKEFIDESKHEASAPTFSAIQTFDITEIKLTDGWNTFGVITNGRPPVDGPVTVIRGYSFSSMDFLVNDDNCHMPTFEKLVDLGFAIQYLEMRVKITAYSIIDDSEEEYSDYDNQNIFSSSEKLHFNSNGVIHFTDCSVGNQITFVSNATLDSPTKLTIFGPCKNPSWSHFVDDVLVTTGQVQTDIDQNSSLVVDCTNGQFSIMKEVQGSPYEDAYTYSDFKTDRFIFLKKGKNVVQVIANSGNPEAVLEVYEYYESV